ncbi:MAG: outer membrane protein assembly factor BamA [Rhodobacteraceae bacterium]|nr:outer membrane protein assembly factor BamA [Paracoccaceae bacterium]
MSYTFRIWIFALIALWTVGSAGFAQAQNYVFNSFQVEGNARIQSSTVLSYAGIEPGTSISAGQLNDAYRRVVDSGIFETVEFVPQGSTLLIRVQEHPTINRISFEGNRRLKDDDLAKLVNSSSRRVFDPQVAEADADIISEAYSQSGRVGAVVTPRIIRRSDNRVDLVFEISEGSTVEIERVSFVGNRNFTDRRLRGVLETKQANILRTFLKGDTLIEDRIQVDERMLTDFYLSRGYVDFKVLSSNVEFSRERDAFFLVMNVQEGQQYKFGQISTVSEMPGVDAAAYQKALKIKPGVIYSPTLIESSIARQERLAVQNGVDFLRVEPRITRNDADQTLDVQFALTKGPRVFIERIDIEGNTTTLDRVIRQRFRIAEGDPFNPREVREASERIKALGFFSDAQVNTREGSTPDKVIVDVDVEEQPTGQLSLGGSYSVESGIGVAIGLSENNFLGRGQRIDLNISTAQDAQQYSFGFSEPYLLGRELRYDFDIAYTETDSSFVTYDTEALFFSTGLTFPVSDNGRLKVAYSLDNSRMLENGSDDPGTVIQSEIDQGSRTSSSVGLTYSYDTRRTGLNPNAGVLLELGSEFAGVGGDSSYIKTTGKAIAQTKVLSEEVVLQATLEGGALTWNSSDASRSTDRFILGPRIFRGFDPAGIGPRDQSSDGNGGDFDDALGGNFYTVARFEAQFPLGLPEEIGLRGALFYDVGNLWNLNNVDTSGATNIVGEGGAFRHVIGFSFLWDTAIGPLRFDFTDALIKESYDKDQFFNFTLSAQF